MGTRCIKRADDKSLVFALVKRNILFFENPLAITSMCPVRAILPGPYIELSFGS
jgi:hypothetical protein